MIEILLKIAILIWPFGQLLRLSYGGVNFYLLDFSALLLATSLIIFKRHQLLKDPLFKPIFYFTLTATFSLLFASLSMDLKQVMLPSFYLLRLWINPSFYFATSIVTTQKITSSFKASVFIFLFLGILQYLVFPDLRDLKYLGFDDHYYRLIGSFFDPNYTGLVLSVLTIFFLGQKLYFPLTLALISLSLTFSRASYLSLIFGLFVQFVFKKPKQLLIMIICLVVLIIIIPKPFGEGVNLMRTFSIYSRLESSAAGLKLFIQKPILGWGYNTLINSDGQRIGVDNSYIYLLATTGVFGLITFISLLSQINKNILPVARAMLGVILFHSLFNNSLFFIWINAFFWLIVGLYRKIKAQN